MRGADNKNYNKTTFKTAQQCETSDKCVSYTYTIYYSDICNDGGHFKYPVFASVINCVDT